MTFALLAILSAAPASAPPMVEADTTIQRAPPQRAQHLTYRGDVPDGYHLVTSPNWGLFGAGAGVFLAAYVPWSVFGTMFGRPENLVPIFGPMLAYRPATGWFSDFCNAVSVFFIGVDVAAQTAGLIMAIVGLAAPRRWLEADEAAPGLSFVPTAPGANFGATLAGRF